MKKLLSLSLLIACLAALRAQTNPEPAAAPADAPPRQAPPAGPTTEILSDNLEWNMKASQQIRRGHVRIANPQYRMTCDVLIAEMPQLAEDKFQQGTAQGNVAIDWLDQKGQTNHAVADQAIYTYSVTNAVTNAWVELTGHAQVTWPNGTWLRGEPIKWDRIRDRITAQNEQTSINTGSNGASFFDTATAPRTNSAKPKAPAPATTP
jgi:lipopolysaccharide export system protein LptA